MNLSTFAHLTTLSKQEDDSVFLYLEGGGRQSPAAQRESKESLTRGKIAGTAA